MSQIRKPRYIAPFDTETTGVNIESARIVTAFIGIMDVETGEYVDRWEWLINPGVEIPEGAAAVHGITTEHAREHGRQDTGKAVFEIAQRLDIIDRQAIPVVIFNAPYDISLLDRETKRHWWGMRPLVPQQIIDPLVIDKAIDPYRKGKRTLTATAPVYDVEVLANAHDAAADCTMAGQIAIRMLQSDFASDFDRTFPGIETVLDLHRYQVGWKAEQAKSFREYLKRNGKSYDDVSGAWPIIPYEDPAWDPELTPSPFN